MAAVFSFAVYIAVTLISAQIQIRKKQIELASLRAQNSQQAAQNAEVQRLLKSGDSEYIERVARDKLSYAKPNERIYIEESGN